uniref:Uncharacterized protein n=1 Tax=Heliothis virescens TaxID=7102 RepID=A0A2A4K6F9_HELVI
MLYGLAGSSRKPLIVVIGAPHHSRSSDYEIQVYSSSSTESNDDSNRNYRFDKLKTADTIYNTLLGKPQDDYINILRDGQAEEDSEEQLQKEMMIADALRSRCQAIVRCEEKCPEDEPKPQNECSVSDDECDATTEKCSESCETPKPKQEKYCPKSCKAIFDHLINCPPPGNEKKKNNNNKKKNQCGPATGKTMPPNWNTGSNDECD